jgi:hypothetical protein
VSGKPEEPGGADTPLGLFEGYGLEVEYMIVDGERLDVVPAADQLLEAAAGDTYSQTRTHRPIARIISTATPRPSRSIGSQRMFTRKKKKYVSIYNTHQRCALAKKKTK